VTSVILSCIPFHPKTIVLLCSYLLTKNGFGRYCIINSTMTLGGKVCRNQRKLGCQPSARELPESFREARQHNCKEKWYTEYILISKGSVDLVLRFCISLSSKHLVLFYCWPELNHFLKGGNSSHSKPRWLSLSRKRKNEFCWSVSYLFAERI
jgi:hypothetical protein